jgi:hypothetical protein
MDTIHRQYFSNFPEQLKRTTIQQSADDIDEHVLGLSSGVHMQCGGTACQLFPTENSGALPEMASTSDECPALTARCDFDKRSQLSDSFEDHNRGSIDRAL